MCKNMLSKVKDFGRKVYRKFEPVIKVCAWIIALILYVRLILWYNKKLTIKTYQEGFGYTKGEATWVYDKLKKLDNERAKVVGKKIGKLVIKILKLEP